MSETNQTIPVDCAVAIDVGGTHIKYALVSAQGEILVADHCDTPRSQCSTAFLTQLEKVTLKLLEHAVQRGLGVSGVGIGVPGLVNNGVIQGAIDNLPELTGVNIVEGLTKRLSLSGVPTLLDTHFQPTILMDNDVNRMAAAEHRYGAARGSNTAVFMTIGTGIGGALLIDGKLFGGENHCGAELGHMVIEHGGHLCTCGNSGCLETYASTTALLDAYRRLSDQPEPELTGKEVVKRYLNGDALAVKSMCWHFDYVALGLSNLINIFNPDLMVLGGGIVSSGNFYVQEVRKRVEKQVLPDAMREVDIVSAEFGNQAGCLGAALLVFDSYA